MKFNLTSVLGLLPGIGPIAAALPQFKEIYDQIVSTFGEKDQDTLREAYADLMADNDEGHRRLQEKLADAAKS